MFWGFSNPQAASPQLTALSEELLRIEKNRHGSRVYQRNLHRGLKPTGHHRHAKAACRIRDGFDERSRPIGRASCHK
jgi:hypothetical protein